MHPRILLVDDDASVRQSLAETIDGFNYTIDQAASAEEAIQRISNAAFHYHLVITDVKMAKLTGNDLLKWVKTHTPETDVVIITAYAEIEEAVKAIHAGAGDYLKKPIEMHHFRNVVARAIERQRLQAENRALKNRLKDKDREIIVGISPAILQVYDTVKRVADTDASVLIQGASGTGKELVANAIHSYSSRKNKPFVLVNCAALPTSLLENELFGHEKEAFTGAASLKKGRFERANGGTIFLDEITEMSLESQSGFLRVLEDGCFHRVGGTEMIEVDVRIIAATNRDIQAYCEEGKFRYDLYYRLNVVPIRMPLLRERKKDIPILIQTFLEEASLKHNRPDIEIDPGVVKQLQEYSWPGNVRELRNMIERAVILCKNNKITSEHFADILDRTPPPTPSVADMEIPSGISLQEMEKLMIEKTLSEFGGHRRKAAELLGISLRTLQYKIKQYNLSI